MSKMNSRVFQVIQILKTFSKEDLFQVRLWILKNALEELEELVGYAEKEGRLD